MIRYDVLAVYEDDGEKYTYSKSVPASDPDEAAEWMDNHLRTELEVDPVGDIEVTGPGDDAPELYPT